MKKDLTIEELFAEMKYLEGKLIRLAEKHHRTLINVSAITYKDIVTSGGKKGDIMLNKVIKKDETLNEFDITLASYESYKKEIKEKIIEMINNNSVEYCIVYFRDTLRWSWKDICKLFHYSRSRASKLYSDYKKRQDRTL